MTIKVRSQRFGGDLLSIQVQAQIGQLESLKIEGVPVVASIEGFAAHQSNDQLGGCLSQKQIVLCTVPKFPKEMAKVLCTTLFSGYLAVPFSSAFS